MSKNSARLLGAHTNDGGGIDLAVRRAARSGMTALQLFTAVPTYYNDRSSIRAVRVERFRSALAASGIRPEHAMAHAAYVINVATPDDGKWARSSAALGKELERSATLGLGSVCFHPGSAGDGERSAAIERIARAIAAALEQVGGPTRLLVENTAGAGRTMGRTAEEIAEILSRVPRTLRARTGYGLDTCHLYASGYDLTASRAAFTAILDTFEQTVGEGPSFFHLNDSEGALGSNRDRHALLGEGAIGVEPFRWLLHDPRSAGVPLILETPHQEGEITPDDDSPDPLDDRMMSLLRALAADG